MRCSTLGVSRLTNSGDRNPKKKQVFRNINRCYNTKKEAVNEECSDAGGHWHPVVGTLTCQVVGFTLEPLGFVVKRPSQLESPYSWLQPGSHCLSRWRGGTLHEWKGNKTGRKRRPQGEQQVAPRRRANVKKKMSEQALVFHRGPIRKHQLAPRCTLSEEVVVLSSSLTFVFQSSKLKLNIYFLRQIKKCKSNN